MQGLLVDKILLLKYLSISHKAGLDQREIITTARSAILFEFIHAYPMPIRKGNTLCWESVQSLTDLIKHTNSFYSIQFLVFQRFCAYPTIMVYTEVPQSCSTASSSKSISCNFNSQYIWPGWGTLKLCLTMSRTGHHFPWCI